MLKPGNDQLCGAIPGSLPVLPASSVSNGQLDCGATAPAPGPESVRCHNAAEAVLVSIKLWEQQCDLVVGSAPCWPGMAGSTACDAASGANAMRIPDAGMCTEDAQMSQHVCGSVLPTADHVMC